MPQHHARFHLIAVLATRPRSPLQTAIALLQQLVVPQAGWMSVHGSQMAKGKTLKMMDVGVRYNRRCVNSSAVTARPIGKLKEETGGYSYIPGTLSGCDQS